ncbi:DUF362 domain-containing protein [Natrarchaeobius oligotrophus]|uniref:DUF362 domain-containing protein n=1 Tax=Natrarchaeobius chitinivorans TaxID=1679083 RepID=A0A3N6MRI2_NATCH|nr:DUF362 domain-containing protein [Natrarchaeobius chitinivorans]RQH00361.1 DUF362 domain-containing protein [Natrarchaeobius chitinivorans]
MDRRVCVAAADESGGWTPDVRERTAAFARPVEAVLEATADSIVADDDGVTIVPDAHYPFHPSTGVVTDPAVVGAICRFLTDRTGTDLSVAVAGSEHVDVDRTAAFLGYPELVDRFDAALFDPADEPRTTVVRDVGGRSVSTSIPTRLLDERVIVVPTLRPTRTGQFAGVTRTLSRFDDRSDGSPEATIAAADAIEPALAVLDATTAYGDDPHATNAVFAGPAASVDAVGASLLGRSIDEDPVLKPTLETEPPVEIERIGSGAVDVESIRDRLSGGRLPATGDAHPAVTAAYRLYAAVGRDAVPPQLEGGR